MIIMIIMILIIIILMIIIMIITILIAGMSWIINSGQGMLPMAGVRTGLGFAAEQPAQYFQVFFFACSLKIIGMVEDQTVLFSLFRIFSFLSIFLVLRQRQPPNF